MPKTIWNLTKTEKDKAQVTIYGPIKDFSSFFSGGVSPQKIMQDLDELAKAREITVRINSGGGSAFAGLAIFELIKAHGAKITVHVDGVAASAASIIAMAGDKIVMGTGAMMMIHNPWAETRGDANELRETANLLDKVSESLINVYEVRTGKTRDELKAMLDKSTWMTADEAVANGFADEVDRTRKISASIQGDFAVFAGEKFALNYFPVAPQLPVSAEEQTPPTEPPEAPNDTENKMEEGDEAVKDLEELKAKHPGIYEAAVKAGVEQERARIKALSELTMPGNEAMIAKAQFETGATAADTAIEILKAENQRRKNMGEKLQNDSDDSGIDKVNPEAPDNSKSETAKIEAAGASIAKFMNQSRGGK